jgi:hypothetical protein
MTTPGEANASPATIPAVAGAGRPDALHRGSGSAALIVVAPRMIGNHVAVTIAGAQGTPRQGTHVRSSF